MSPNRIRRAISEYSSIVHACGFVANHDGNLSHRASASDRFFITPTSVSKRLCAPEILVECDLDGRPLGRGKPPSEVALHVGAYRSRADVSAVIHAHPPYASTFALVQEDLGPVEMPEVLVSLGERIPMVPLVLPKDPRAAELVGAALRSADVALMAGNGAIAVGGDLEQAFLRLELLEHYAKIIAIARGALGTPVPLDASSRERLLEMRQGAGLARAASPERSGGEDARRRSWGAPGTQGGPMPASVRAIVADEVRRALGAKK